GCPGGSWSTPEFGIRAAEEVACGFVVSGRFVVRKPDQSGRAGRPKTGRGVGAMPQLVEGVASGKRNGEVVQRSKGFRFHPAGGWRGRVRSLLRDPGRRLQDACRRRAVGVRHRPWTEGTPGRERP